MILAVAGLLATASGAAGATFTVNLTTDAPDAAVGSGGCDTGAGCSLRAAIQESNASAGTMDTIAFGIPGGGAHTITLTNMAALPTITNPVTIDGYSQPGSTPNSNTGFTALNTVLNVVLDGNGKPGLVVSAGATTIKGLVIQNTGGNGIALNTGGANHIEGNFIGTNGAGTIAVPNGGAGVRIESGDDNAVGGLTAPQRNLISGNNGTFVPNLPGYGVNIESGSGTLVQGNLIGTNAAGTGALGNQLSGVRVGSPAAGAPDTRVGGDLGGAGNVLSANGGSSQGWGVFVGPGPGETNIKIQGNRIGTNVTGTAPLGNNPDGIELLTDESVLIGGTTASAGNVVSGNVLNGISINGGGGHVVEGNRIGTNLAGTAAVGNGASGVFQNGNSGNHIGQDNTSGARNIISGNGGSGVRLAQGASNNFVQGNYIGTRANGAVALPNQGAGVFVEGGSGNTIGGFLYDSVDGNTGNLISGNAGPGVALELPEGPAGASSNVVSGNRIGVDTNGNQSTDAVNIGNGGAGVYIHAGNDNLIGGSGHAGNVIAFNHNRGVLLEGTDTASALRNRISSNSIFSNASLSATPGLGIDLLPDGVTANDVGDGDSGNNQLQNFPVLHAVTPGAGTQLAGTLISAPNTTYTLEFFQSAVCDHSGFGEGEQFLDSETVTTDGVGYAIFSAQAPATVPSPQVVTATATDPAGNTSEFSPCRTSGTSGPPQERPSEPQTNQTPPPNTPMIPNAPPPTTPIPPTAKCPDVLAPITTLKAAGLSRTRVTLTLKGKSRDPARCRSGLRKVDVSLARVKGRTGVNCRFIRSSTRYALTARKNCRRPSLFRATGKGRWKFTFKVALHRGQYRAQARGTDKAGNKETPRKRRNIVFFTVR